MKKSKIVPENNKIARFGLWVRLFGEIQHFLKMFFSQMRGEVDSTGRNAYNLLQKQKGM